MANGGYLESDEGIRARKDEIEQIDEHFKEIVNSILNPEPEVDLSENQFFAAGESGMDRVRWEYAPQQG